MIHLIQAAEGFDWDDGNLLKSESKHGITHATIEDFFKEKVWVVPDFKHSVSEERFYAFGKTKDYKPMFVCFTIRFINTKSLIRPISARFMHTKEFNKYVEAYSKI